MAPINFELGSKVGSVLESTGPQFKVTYPKKKSVKCLNVLFSQPLKFKLSSAMSVATSGTYMLNDKMI